MIDSIIYEYLLQNKDIKNKSTKKKKKYINDILENELNTLKIIDNLEASN